MLLAICLNRQSGFGLPTYIRIAILPQPDCCENHRSELAMKPSTLRQTRLTPTLHLWTLSPASVSFENLPSEIWHEACANLDRKSLATARRVCHRLADIAAHHLFRELYVNWLPSSVDRLSTIASHPKLNHYVQALVFEQELLRQDLTNFDDWKSRMDTSPLLDRHRSGDDQTDPECNEMHPEIDLWDGPLHEAQRCLHAILSRFVKDQGTILADAGGLGIKFLDHLAQDEFLGCMHGMVSKLVKDQRALLADPGTPGMLGHLISSFSHLNTVRMTAMDSYGWTSYDDGELDTEALNQWNAARESLQAGLLVSSAFEYDEDPLRKALQPIKYILDAAAAARTRIRNLQIEVIPAEFWMEGDEPWTYKSDTQRNKVKGLPKLRSLDIRLIIDRGNNRMAHFLQHCANITNLKLHIYARSFTNQEADSSYVTSLWDSHPLGEISEVLKPLRFGQLQNLVIDRFSITEEAFVTFMKTHAETMKSIIFKIPYMITPGHQSTRFSSWEHAIKEVAPFMSLKHVDLGNILDYALSRLYSEDMHLGGCYCHGVRNQRIRMFASSASAYLMSRGQAQYPKYMPLKKENR